MSTYQFIKSDDKALFYISAIEPNSIISDFRHHLAMAIYSSSFVLLFASSSFIIEEQWVLVRLVNFKELRNKALVVNAEGRTEEFQNIQQASNEGRPDKQPWELQVRKIVPEE